MTLSPSLDQEDDYPLAVWFVTLFQRLQESHYVEEFCG